MRGKFIIKNWGKNKIKMGLMAKRVFDENQFNIVVAAEIEDEDYHQTINVLIEKKNLLITEEDDFKRKDKLYRYMLNKGYESELVVEALIRLNIGGK